MHRWSATPRSSPGGGHTMTPTVPAADVAVATQRFSTEAFAPRERVPVWRELFGRTISRLELEPLSDSELMAQATLRRLPGLGLVSMASAELRYQKLASLIDNDDVILAILDTGRWSSHQLGREVTLFPGDAALCSNADVAGGHVFGRRTMVRVPRKAIAHMMPDINAAVMRRIPAQTEGLRLLRQYVRLIQEPESVLTPDLQRTVVTHIYDLLAATLGAIREAPVEAEGRGLAAARLKTIKDDIATNLSREDLSVGALAVRHQVTPRYIQMLFEAEGMTFTEYVLGERLARACRTLSDPRHRNEKIASVAFDCGFGDLSYFNRVFRRRYGLAPSDVRAAAQRH